MRRALLTGVTLGLVVAAIALRHRLPPLDDQLIAGVRDAGTLGPFLLGGVMVLQCIVAPIPSEPVMMAAGYLYGRGGFVLSWLGVVVGAVACFALARVWGRSLVERFVRPAHLAALDAWVGERGVPATFAAVLALRLFAFASFDVVSYACGLIRFPLRWFVVATAVGVLPKVFAFTYAGAAIDQRPGWLTALMVAGTFGVLAAGPWLFRRASRARGAT